MKRGNGEISGERRMKDINIKMLFFSSSPFSPFLLKGFKVLSSYIKF
jgi:hypothetical protein